MLEYFSKNITVALGAANAQSILPFNTRKIQKGSSVIMSGNNAEINECGVYNVNCGVSFSASVAGDITFILFVDGVAQPQTERTVTAAVGDTYSVDFSTYVTKQGNNCRCNPCSAPTSVYVAVSASVADTDLTVETSDIQIYKATR